MQYDVSMVKRGDWRIGIVFGAEYVTTVRSADEQKAIKAALHPTKSDNLYWVTINYQTKETVFSSNKEDHDKAVGKFEAWCKTAKDKSGCPVS